jgi:hypothetical protein
MRKMNVYKILVGKSHRRRPHGRHGCKWEENVYVGLKEVRCEGIV